MKRFFCRKLKLCQRDGISGGDREKDYAFSLYHDIFRIFSIGIFILEEDEVFFRKNLSFFSSFWLFCSNFD